MCQQAAPREVGKGNSATTSSVSTICLRRWRAQAAAALPSPTIAALVITNLDRPILLLKKVVAVRLGYKTKNSDIMCSRIRSSLCRASAAATSTTSHKATIIKVWAQLSRVAWTTSWCAYPRRRATWSPSSPVAAPTTKVRTNPAAFSHPTIRSRTS